MAAPAGELLALAPSPADPAAPRAVDSAVARTAAVVVVLNILLQAGVYLWSRTSNAEPATGIKVSLAVAVAFYGITYLLIASRLNRVALAPLWLQGGARAAGRFGIAVGIGGWGAAIALGWVLSKRVLVDPSAELLVAGAGAARIALTVAVLVLLGPWIEELLFRGLILESLRYRGARTAVIVSSMLFALFHLRPGILYYGSAGAVLGIAYLKRGLKASFFAHATFNGCIVVTAILAGIGPARVVERDGMTIRLPHAWHVVEEATAGNAVLVARGPSGAQVVVARFPLPSMSRFDIDRLAAAIDSGEVPMPDGILVNRGTARVVELPAGSAVHAAVSVQRHAAEVAIVPQEAQLWTLLLITGGSDQASRDFDGMLRSLALSPNPA